MTPVRTPRARYVNTNDARLDTFYAFADSGAGDACTVAVVTFNITAEADSRALLGPRGFSAGEARYLQLEVTSGLVPIVAFSLVSNGGRAVVRRYIAATNSWGIVGGGPASAGEARDVRLALGPDDSPFVAYADMALGGRATVRLSSLGNAAWSSLGSPGTASLASVEGALGLTVGSDSRAHIAFKDMASSVRVQRFGSGAWGLVFVAAAGGPVVGLDLAMGPGNLPHVAVATSTSLSIFSSSKPRVPSPPPKPRAPPSPPTPAGQLLGTASASPLDAHLVVAMDGTAWAAFRTATSSFILARTLGNGTLQQVAAAGQGSSPDSSSAGILDVTSLDVTLVSLALDVQPKPAPLVAVANPVLRGAVWIGSFDEGGNPTEAFIPFGSSSTLPEPFRSTPPPVRDVAVRIVNTNNVRQDSFYAFGDGGVGNETTVIANTANQTVDTWSLLGPRGFSIGQARYVQLEVTSGLVPIVAFSLVSNGGRAVVRRYIAATNSWGIVGGGPASAGEARDVRLALGPDDSPFVAYADMALGGRATALVSCRGTSQWSTLGTAGFSPGSVEGALGLAVGSDSIVHLAFKTVASSASVARFNGGAWLAAFVAAAGGPVVGLDLAMGPGNQPHVAVATSSSVSVFKGLAAAFTVTPPLC